MQKNMVCLLGEPFCESTDVVFDKMIVEVQRIEAFSLSTRSLCMHINYQRLTSEAVQRRLNNAQHIQGKGPSSWTFEPVNRLRVRQRAIFQKVLWFCLLMIGWERCHQYWPARRLFSHVGKATKESWGWMKVQRVFFYFLVPPKFERSKENSLRLFSFLKQSCFLVPVLMLKV